MRKKKIILSTLALLLITTIGFNIKKVTATISSPDFNMQFNNLLTTNELKNFINKYQLILKELYFNQGEINGGYTVLDNKNIEEIITDLDLQHQQFLNTAIEQNKISIEKNKNTDEIQKIQTLQNLFLKESNKDTKDQLLISGIDINVSDKQLLKTLKNDPLVKELVKKQTRKLNNLFSNNDGTQNNNEQNAINSLTHETWAPYSGTSLVTRTNNYQTFSFNNISNFTSNTTYEHETQVYNRNFANYGGYWSSNLPTPYYDTPFSDSIDNFTIGTPRAHLISRYTLYYTSMSLAQGSVSTATVRIKGQKGHRIPSFCYSTWCVFPVATTASSMATYTAPNTTISWQY